MTCAIRTFFLACFCCVFATSVDADESRPAHLQLTLTDSDNVSMVFKVPALGDRRLGLYPKFPANCEAVFPPSARIVDNAYTERATFRCAGGLVGETIFIDGLSSTFTEVLARVIRPDGATQVARLTPSKPSFVVEATPDALTVVSSYLQFGFAHILSGFDHLLFVLALLILVPGTRTLIWTITAFTVAHSLTLAAATLGFVEFPQPPVEAVIALSIVFVASEIIHVSQGRPGLTQRRPWIVAFTFGLLHGFGFAGALTEAGLPEQSIPLALLFFNVGVELGQLVFVAAVLVLIGIAKRVLSEPPKWMPAASAYAIGIVASYWTIERVLSFW
jgi:hydrogenase/urease accessory protein HupE